MTALKFGIVFFILLVPAFAEQPQYGERPANSVFDPKGVLTAEETDEISEPLLKILDDEGIDILVVVIPEIGDAPPRHVARGYADKWAQTEINAVVLHVPGKGDSPWIFPGNVMNATVMPEVMKQGIKDAESRALAEVSDVDKIRAASIEAADIMRFSTGANIIQKEEAISRQLQARLDFERKSRLIKLSFALGAAALIPLIIGTVFFFISMKNSGAKQFPAVRVVRRFGAPYSGGNNAVSSS